MSSFPESYYCPLTHEVMHDPVVDKEGNSFERSAITEWLRTNATSPITRAKMTANDLAPNRALKEAIEEKKGSGGSGAGASVPDCSSSDVSETASDLAGAATSADPSTSAGGRTTSGATSPDVFTVELNHAANPKPGSIIPVMATVRCPPGQDHAPTDVCCVVDVSGSMGQNVDVPDSKESSNLTILDYRAAFGGRPNVVEFVINGSTLVATW